MPIFYAPATNRSVHMVFSHRLCNRLTDLLLFLFIRDIIRSQGTSVFIPEYFFYPLHFVSRLLRYPIPVVEFQDPGTTFPGFRLIAHFGIAGGKLLVTVHLFALVGDRRIKRPIEIFYCFVESFLIHVEKSHV
jgi:hypothetical protein